MRADEDSVVMLCSGAPPGERQISWNFVASNAALIAQTRQDGTAASAGLSAGGRFILPSGEAEHIPLPEQ